VQFSGSRLQAQAGARRALPFCWALAIGATFLQQAKADFIGAYALSNFALTNINSDGNAATPDGGMTLVLTGPNNGSGLAGTTDFTISLPASGPIQFQYLYSSLDTPGFDFAGYLLGSNFVQLADTDGQSGSLLLSGTAGEIFGFRMGSLDNTGEPGILTVSSFSAPGGGGVPETGTLSMMLAAAGMAVAGRARLRQTGWRKQEDA
jgi:hypothetical protein